MVSRIHGFLLALLVLSVLASLPASAQPAGGDAYSEEELDQLLAPIALYPDQLLTQILIAATYPLDVAEAARFVQQNPNLRGDALDQALADKNWDPSVQSLAAFPQVLAMMDEKLAWTQRLGDAFLVDQPRVMNTVQVLRRKAQAAGNLRPTPQQSVLTRDSEIIIEPAQSGVVYVPAYDPLVIYGPWWAPAYPPWFWYPPPNYGYAVGALITTGIMFGVAWSISQNHWRWAHPDWRAHQINVDTINNRFWSRAGNPRPDASGVWQHTPAHRKGVAYPDAATRDRFIKVAPDAVRARQDFRGREPRRPEPNMVRPEANTIRLRPDTAPPLPIVIPSTPRAQGSLPRPAPSTLDPGLSRQQTHVSSQRGQESRRAIGPPPAAVRQGSREPASAEHPGKRQR